MALVAQPSLLGLGPPAFDPWFSAVERRHLGDGAWVDYGPGWVAGHQELFDLLVAAVEWEQQRRPMYERMVDVPRLTGSLPDGFAQEALIEEMRLALSGHYGQMFERIGLALYRNGDDSVAWHGDMVAREMPEALVATVSLGEPRKFSLRPKGGGRSVQYRLGHGDLIVMGGTCQRTWDHSIPKVARAGPRLALMFRPVWS